MKTQKIIVIGAGAAGLMAAGQAAARGADVVLLEKMSQCALKLAITGKGRCNITNAVLIREFEEYVRTNFRFLKHALYSFDNQETVKFFEDLGVKTVVERGNRVFPVTNRATDVCEALIKWNRDNGVRIFTNSAVAKLIVKDHKVVAVKTRQINNIPARIYEADKVIVATGGASYPRTGSNGEGYRLAESIGHTLVPIKAALVPLETVGNMAQKMQGVSLKNVRASVWVEGKKVAEEFGEMLFTHFGLSGPIIISLSKYAVNKSKVRVKVDLKPALDDKKLDARLLRDFADKSKQQMRTVLRGLLPAKMIQVCLEQTKIDAYKQAQQVVAEERKRLRLFLKNLEFEIKGARPIAEAIVTAGGVNIKEINSKTMASRIVENVYFAGEILDVDAETGGYNLQIAFSTGWLAGQD